MLEIETHVGTAAEHIKDLGAPDISNQSKFLLAYSAGHHMLTAAIKMEGYKPVNQPGHRSILYDLIGDLFPGAAAAQDPMTRAHNRRNKAEYEIVSDVTNTQITELVAAVKSVKEELDHNLKALKKKQTSAQPAPAPPATGPAAAPQSAAKPKKKPPFKKV